MRKVEKLALKVSFASAVLAMLFYATVIAEVPGHQHARGRVCWFGLLVGLAIGLGFTKIILWVTLPTKEQQDEQERRE